MPQTRPTAAKPLFKAMHSILLSATLSASAIGQYCFADAPDFNRSINDGVFEDPRQGGSLLFSQQIVDLDGDKDLDLVYFDQSFIIAYWLRNDGNVVAPAFQNSREIANFNLDLNLDQNFGRPPILNDINGDGLFDLISSNAVRDVQKPFIIPNTSQGFNATDKSQWLSLESLVGAAKANEINTLINADSISTASLNIADLDNDKDIDIILNYSWKGKGGTEDVVIKLLNNGPNTKPQFYQAPITEPLQPQSVSLKDFYGINTSSPAYDNDGICPVTWANFTIFSPLCVDGNDSSIAMDIDGNGETDILNPVFPPTDGSPLDLSSSRWLLNRKTNDLYRLSIDTLTAAIYSAKDYTKFADMDKDGFTDIILYQSNGGNSRRVYTHQRSTPQPPISFNGKTYRLTEVTFEAKPLNWPTPFESLTPATMNPNASYNFIDMDADGDADVLAQGNMNGTPGVYYAENLGLNSQGLFQWGSIQRNPFGLTNDALGENIIGNDIDQDGDIDLLIQKKWFKNIGSRTQPSFAAGTDLAFNLNPNFNFSGFTDLDADGDQDAYSLGNVFTGYGNRFQINNQINTRDDQLAHLSVRAFSDVGEGLIIGGFEVTGEKPQRVIIKGSGPSLTQSGVNQALADPVLTLFKGQQVIASNDNWQADPKSQRLAGTAFEPSDSKEAMLTEDLAPGVYTVHLTDKQRKAGIGILSIDTPDYDYLTKPRPKQRSFRVQVGKGEDVAIAGFVIQDGPKQVLIKGIGPSLSNHGVKNALADPELLLFKGSTLIATNQSWSTLSNAKQLSDAGQAPQDNREAAILQKLEPGTYTVQLRGQNGSQGVGIIGVSTLK